jgi:hypothetical protein
MQGVGRCVLGKKHKKIKFVYSQKSILVSITYRDGPFEHTPQSARPGQSTARHEQHGQGSTGMSTAQSVKIGHLEESQRQTDIKA